MNDPRLVLAGLVTGLLVGMTGMGGGALMTPILIFLFNFNPATAIGTDILHGAIFKSFGAVRHRRLGTVRARLAAWMLLGSAPASLLGVWFATYLTDRYGDEVDSVQGQVLGYTLLFGALAFVAKGLTHSGGASGLGRLTRRDRIVAVSIGVVGGFIVGLTSVGSGTLFALAMLLAYPLAAKYVVGTDIAHAAALLWVAGLGHLVAGNVDLPAIAWLLVGSIPGVLIGSQISVGLPETALRLALASALALSGLKLLDVPYANQIILASLAAGGIALAAWGSDAGRPPGPAGRGDGLGGHLVAGLGDRASDLVVAHAGAANRDQLPLQVDVDPFHARDLRHLGGDRRARNGRNGFRAPSRRRPPSAVILHTVGGYVKTRPVMLQRVAR